LSNLAAYSVLTFNTIIPTPALAATQALYPQLVLNGSLLGQLQTTSALYSNVVLIFLPTPATLSFSDNPPPGEAFVIAGVTLTNFASSSLTDRLLYDFVAALASVSVLNSSSVAIFPTNSSQSLSLNVFFRVQVPASNAPATLQLLTAELNGSGLATALAQRNGVFSTFVVLLPPYVVYYVACVFCNITMPTPPTLYRPFQCTSSLVGNCAVCSACPFGTYMVLPCSQANDTVCAPVPGFTSSVPLQLESASAIAVTPASLVTPTVSQRSFSTVGQLPGSTISGTATLLDGRLSQSWASSTAVPLGLPVTVDATLLDTGVYFDAPLVRVALQVRDASFNTKTQSTSVYANVSGTVGTCTPAAVSGLCVVTVTVPVSTGPANTTLVVSYGFAGAQASQQAARSFSQAVVFVPTQRPANFSNNVQIVFPSRNVYVGEVIDVPVYGHSATPIGAFTITVTVVSGPLQLTALVIGNSNYYTPSTAFSGTTSGTITTVVNSALQSLATVPQVSNGQQTDQLLFYARFTVAGAGVAQVAVDISDILIVDRLQYLLINGVQATSASRIRTLASGRQASYTNGLGQMTCVTNVVVAVFGSLSNGLGELVNTAILNSAQVFPLTVSGVTLYPSATVSTLSSGLSCSSTPAILGVTPSCTQLQFTGSETGGASQVSVSITLTSPVLGRVVPFRVWAPTLPITLSADYATLYAVQAMREASDGCRPTYMNTIVRAATLFTAGTGSFAADVTALVRGAMTSSNTAVLTVNQTLGMAFGRSAGVAVVSVGALGSVSITVSSVVVMVSGVDVQQVNSLATNASLSSNVAVYGSSQTMPLTVEDQASALVLAAWLFDPILLVQYRLYLLPGSVLLSTSSSNIAYLTDAAVSAKMSGQATISAQWLSSCANTSIYNGSYVVTVTLAPAVQVLPVITATRLTLPGTSAAAAGLPTSATITSLTLRYPTYSRNALLDPRTTYDVSQAGGVFNVSISGSTVLITPLKRGSGVLTFRFAQDNITSSVTISVVTGLQLQLSLAYTPFVAGNASVLQQLGNSGQFQMTTITCNLLLTDATLLSVTPTLADLVTPSLVTIRSGVVSVVSNSPSGVANILASFSGLTATAPITISATPLSVTSLLSPSVAVVSGGSVLSGPTLSGTGGAVFQLQASLVFAGGYTVPLSSSNVITYSNVVTFTSSSSAAATVDANGRVTLQGNAPDFITINLTSGGVSTSLQVYCNLMPGANDVDLGSSTNAPVGPIASSGTTFNVPVYINAPSPGFGGISLQINYDNTALAFVSIAVGSGLQNAAFTFQSNQPSPTSVVFNGASTQGVSGSSILVATLTFRALRGGLSQLSGSITNLYTVAVPPTLIVPIGTPFVAGAIPVFVRGARRRRSEAGLALLPVAPALQPLVEVHRRGSCTTYPQGDSTLDCLFNIADVLQTLLYIASSSQSFGDANGPALRALTQAQLDAMNPDFNGVIDSTDSTLLSSILIGSLRFVMRPTFVPVTAVPSRCNLQINVDVRQSSSAADFSTNPSAASLTNIYFLLLPRSSVDQATFTSQFSSTSWNTSATTITLGTFTAGLVQATYLPGTTIFAVSVQTTFTLAQISVAVLQINTNAISAGVNSFLLVGSGTAYPSGSFSVTQASFGTVSVVARTAFDAVSVLNNSRTSLTCQALRTPTNVTGVSPSPYSMVVSWVGPVEQPYRFQYYLLLYRRQPGQANALPNTTSLEQWSLLQSVTVPVSTVPSISASGTITGLQPFIIYEFRVVAYMNEDGLGYFSSVASATTQQTAPSGPPLQLGVQVVSSTAVILTWMAPLIYLQNGIITFYALNYTRLPNQYRADPLLPDSVITVVPTALSSTIFNLEINIDYVFSIAAVTEISNTGPFTAPVNGTTLLFTPGASPSITQFSGLSALSLSLAWVEPTRPLQHGAITGYIIRYRRRGSTLFPDGTLVNDQLLGGAETLYTFPLPATGPTMSTVLPPAISGANMVRPFLDYEVQVAAVNSFAVGPYSNLSVGSALTAAPAGPPLSVDSQLSSSSAITVTWALPDPIQRNGVVTSFMLYYQRVAGQANSAPAPFFCPTALIAGVCAISVTRSLAPTAQTTFSLTLSGLESYVYYSANVSALTSAGEGPTSALTTSRTDEDLPTGTVQGLDATALSSSAVGLQWSPPLAYLQEGVILGYKLSVSRVAGNFDPSFLANPLVNFDLPLSATISNSGASTYTVTGLQNFITYSFSIVPYTKVGLGPATAVQQTTLQDLPAGAPQNFAASIVSTGNAAKSVGLSWQPPVAYLQNGVVRGYVVSYLTTDPRLVSQSPPVSVVASQTSTVIPGLLPFVNYAFTIWAFTDAGNSSFTTSTVIVTESSLPTGAPLGLTASASTASCSGTVCAATVTVTWSDPLPPNQAGTFNGVSVQYFQPSSAFNVAVIDPSLAQFTAASPQTLSFTAAQLSGTSAYVAATKTYLRRVVISGLQAYNEYTISVAFGNNVGLGSYAAITPIRTAPTVPTGPPLTVSLSATYNQISVSWAPPTSYLRHGNVTQYVVRYTRLPTLFVDNGGGLDQRNNQTLVNTLTVSATVQPTDSTMGSLTISNSDVLAYTTFGIEVLAVVAGQSGPYSTSVSIRTAPRAPDTPPTPMVTGTGTSSVTLQWPVINTMWGPITRVQVVVEPDTSTLFVNCNTTVTCNNGVQDNYETGVDCGGDCKPCNLLAFSALLAVGNYSSVLANSSAAYITYDHFLTFNESSAGTITVGDGLYYGPSGLYYNGPLNAGTRYNFRLLAYTGNSTALMSVSGSSCSGSQASVASTQASSSGGGSAVAAIAAAIIIVFVVVIIVVVLRHRKKNDKSNHPKDLCACCWAGVLALFATCLAFCKREDKGSRRNEYAEREVPMSNTQYASRPAPVVALAPDNSIGAAAPAPIVVKPASAPPPAPSKASKAASVKAKSSTPVKAAPAAAPVSAVTFGGACVVSGIQLPPVQRNEVPVMDLGRIIQQMSANSDFAFSEEYESIESGDQLPRTRAQDPENKMKNRYANILAYDHSRVILPILNGDPKSDYINANFIDGFSVPRFYIAAQGPTPLTVNDFWRMIWDNRVQVVVMVTNLEEKGRVKCHRYWPERVQQEMALGEGMSLSLSAEEEFPDYVIRTATLQCNGDSRVVRQFHYISWPDHGVPESTAVTVTILKKARAARTPGGGPMLVHCSAGVGRTGTLLAIDHNMDRAIKTGTVDVLGCMNEMRRQRSTMVQTEEQYIFIYRTLLDACSQTVTDLTPEALRKHYAELHMQLPEGGTPLEIEFKKVSDFAPPALRTDSAQLAANKPKNRFQNILPYENTRVKLQAIPGVAGSDYINASWIDGYKQRGAFIATQGPMEHTVADFWRMTWERECHCIVMLTALSESGRAKSEQYWPDPDEPPLNTGDYQIVLRGETNLGWCVERTLQIVDLVSETAREVRHWQYLAWPASGIPESGRTLVELIQRIEDYERALIVVPEESIYGNAKAIAEQAILKQMRPVVVHCSAGVGRTGVFCALAIGIKRMQEEQKMDLNSLTKHLRTQRPAMIQTADQYEFVYRCMLDYLDMSVAPAAVEESMYQNLPPKRVPPKPPTRSMPPAPAPAPAATFVNLPGSLANGSNESDDYSGNRGERTNTMWQPTSTDFHESSFMEPDASGFGFGEEA